MPGRNPNVNLLPFSLEPLVVFKGKGYSDAPKLAVDGNGTVHLAFAESDGGPFGRYHIRYARSMDGARSFEAARDISSATGQGASFPSLDVDASGNVYVMWEIFPDRRSRPRGLGMAVSRDGGQSFSAPQTIPGSVAPDGGANGSHQGLLMDKLAAGDAGAVAAVNSSLKLNERSRVWLIRGNLGR